jgi:hypothetical protein
MLALSPAVALGFAPAGVVSPVRNIDVRMETKADLEEMAVKLNPVVKFWDPLQLADAQGLMGQSNAESIGWLRHAEIKHGRIAMFAFVGYCVQSNGIYFPWDLANGVPYADIAAAGSPPAQWDALPTAAKWQIFFFIAGLELWSECAMDKHYMKGGKPGAFPSFAPIRDSGLGQPPFDLFDPFGFSKKKTPELKERGLLIELNNGRLAQLGIMSLVSEAKVPGAVPGLASANIAPYDGEVMSPWAAGDVSVPLVKEMLTWVGPWGSI